MNFVGSGKLLTNADYVSVANAMGVAVATIQGVIDVEAAGHGFDYSSRPKILTEPHVFYRLLGEGAKRNQAVASGIAYEHWGMKPYPKTSDGNYVRLQQMMAIDEDCALRATSWGLTQIMGDNYAECEYNTVLEMVEDYMTGEAAQLVAFQHLLENWHLIPALKKRNAAAFAARYNGPGFKKNGYDTKLIHAWRIRDRGHVQGFMDSVPTEVRVPDPTTPLVAEKKREDRIKEIYSSYGY